MPTIAEAFAQWKTECDNRFNQLKSNEEELNRIFIDIYGLQDELTPEVEDKDCLLYTPDEATRVEAATMDELKKAIVNAEFYVAGEHIEVKAGDAKAKIDQALEYLVSHVYSELDLITKNAETDADIL